MSTVDNLYQVMLNFTNTCQLKVSGNLLYTALCQPKGTTVQGNMEPISLKQDNGDDLRFQGCLFSECLYFDDDNNTMTKQELYRTESGEQVYYVVRSSGKERSRQAYRLSMREDNCIIKNGKTEMTLQFDMLMLAVRALCGLDADATPSLDMVEEMLKAANN